MIEIEVKCGQDPKALAELIASTLPGHPLEDPDSDLACTGRLVREQQEQAEQQRPSWQQMETVNFQTIEDDQDWTDV